MSSDDRDALIAFERICDERAGASPLGHVSASVMLLRLYWVFIGLITADVTLVGDARHLPRTDTLASRIWVFADILARGPRKWTEDPAELQTVDPDGAHVDFMLAYGALCEVMPQVHRGLLEVSGSLASGFVLHHPDENFALFEARDVVLSHLSSPLSFELAGGVAAKMELPGADDFARLAAAPDEAELTALEVKMARAHELLIDDTPLLSDAGLAACVGVEQSGLRRLQALLFGAAEVELRMLEALLRRRATGVSVYQALSNYVMSRRDPQRLIARLGRLSGLQQAQVEAVLATFTLDLDAEPPVVKHARNGYFPPLVRVGGKFAWSPFLIKEFVHERNLLFATSRLRPAHFNAVVSQHLEPKLMTDLRELFDDVTGVEWVSARSWSASSRTGEFDALIVQPDARTIVHVQGKAALPPEGAGMMHQREERLAHGLEQLERVRNLDDSVRAGVLSEATGRNVDGWRVIDLLLSRAGFGTAPLWRLAMDGGVVVATVALLTLTSGRLERSGRPRGPAEVLDAASTMLDDIVNASAPEWTTSTTNLGDVSITGPVLEFDQHALGTARAEVMESQLGARVRRAQRAG